MDEYGTQRLEGFSNLLKEVEMLGKTELDLDILSLAKFFSWSNITFFVAP